MHSLQIITIAIAILLIIAEAISLYVCRKSKSQSQFYFISLLICYRFEKSTVRKLSKSCLLIKHMNINAIRLQTDISTSIFVLHLSWQVKWMSAIWKGIRIFECIFVCVYITTINIFVFVRIAIVPGVFLLVDCKQHIITVHNFELNGVWVHSIAQRMTIIYSTKYYTQRFERREL